ncbi:unnamed protein product [Thlaspi arvense]|uniref:Uncharacterized protein n=1 Tax=Thlaspi arvense TaxID=13288 RepID=A0AAU9RAG4_THLAR|nr:unnamed protein product [Thlaspi arvense]
MVSRAEKSVDSESKKEEAYESLIALYGDAGKAEDVYRLWDLYKDLPPSDKRKGHRSAICLLLKLNDIDGAAKVFESPTNYAMYTDIRSLAMMASAYCERGQLEEAENVFGDFILKRRDEYIDHFTMVYVYFAVGSVLYTLALMVKFILKLFSMQ